MNTDSRPEKSSRIIHGGRTTIAGVAVRGATARQPRCTAKETAPR